MSVKLMHTFEKLHWQTFNNCICWQHMHLRKFTNKLFMISMILLNKSKDYIVRYIRIFNRTPSRILLINKMNCNLYFKYEVGLKKIRALTAGDKTNAWLLLLFKIHISCLFNKQISNSCAK